jgi:threonine-phosphate decarboxylase
MLQPRPNITQLPAVNHGGINYPELQKLGIAPAEVLDFSVCTNPCGPPDGLKEALATTDWEHYPDSASTALKTRLAKKLGVSTSNLITGSGSTELFRLAATAYLFLAMLLW